MRGLLFVFTALVFFVAHGNVLEAPKYPACGTILAWHGGMRVYICKRWER